MYFRYIVAALSVLLLLLLAGCRGPIRNPAALTPLATIGGLAPPTSTVLPSPSVPPTETPVVVLYIIQEGDNLYNISLQYGTTVEAIREVNGLEEGAVLQIGQELKIPQP